MTVSQHEWWKSGTVYQIYPASFKDSNGDGLGDIQGIISKVDYLNNLGIDIIWVSPMYKSPQYDMGYDISDYTAVHEPYGTVADMQQLIDACHSRKMKIILDLVVNHTSHEHHWFQESKSSKTNPKRDWYIWKPARYAEDGTRMPPNNWRSFFSGPAWTWDETTQEYYLHLFASQQPDLNWECEEARKAIHQDAMEFWLKMGVDGFRVDTVNMYSKGTELPDAPVVHDHIPEQPAEGLFCNGPRMHEFLREMHTEVLNKYDTMTVGELPHTPDPAHVLKYVGSNDKQLSMVFQFDIVDLGQGSPNKYEFTPYTLPEMKAVIEKWQSFISGTDGWTTAFCENHDQGRSVSRFASDEPQYREKSARMLALMMSAMTGTLFVYQGQEIGMINAPKDWPIEDYQDIESVNYYKSIAKQTNNNQADLDRVMRGIQILGRDHARLPMQWDSSANAGFSEVKPWMRVHDLYPEINVEDQMQDKNSVLSFWRSALKLRKEHEDVFTFGDYKGFDMENEHTYMFMKEGGGKKVLVVCNFTAQDQSWTKPQGVDKLELLVGSQGAAGEEGTLGAWEGRIYTVV